METPEKLPEHPEAAASHEAHGHHKHHHCCHKHLERRVRRLELALVVIVVALLAGAAGFALGSCHHGRDYPKQGCDWATPVYGGPMIMPGQMVPNYKLNRCYESGFGGMPTPPSHCPCPIMPGGTIQGSSGAGKGAVTVPDQAHANG